MSAVDYALRRAWTALGRSAVSTLCAVLAIALAMTVLGLVLLVSVNADQILSRWRASAEFSVYLSDDATSGQQDVIRGVLVQHPQVSGVEFVSKIQALDRFRDQFADLGTLTADLGDNPFPASFEVRVREAASEDEADALLQRVATLPGVTDIRYDRAWLLRMGRAVGALRRAGMALALLLAAAAAATVASVVRLGMYARRDELEIMELVGASASYVRGPFVAEGLLQGGLGTSVALLLVALVYRTAAGAWAGELAAVFDGLTLRFLPVTLTVGMVLGGLAVGSLGGFIASRRLA